MKHPICRVEEVPETGTRVFGFFGREVHVWRTRGKIRAAANACLHLGGPLECKDGALVCPWHGARYSLDDGHRTDGPDDEPREKTDDELHDQPPGQSRPSADD